MSIIDKPTDHFETKLYTGTGSSLANSSLNFQPDFTWIKGRSGATEHVLTDSVRGVTKELSSNDSGAEETVAQGLTAFGSNGFTVGTDGSYNTSSATYSSWNWKAGTAFTNDASATGIGTIDSTGSVNTDAGFSIMSYTGNGSAGANFAHGLEVKPACVIVKRRNASSNWQFVSKALSATPFGSGNYLKLNSTDGMGTNTAVWNTEPTSSLIYLQANSDTNASGGTYVCYAFAEKQGYSKFGSYTGNGSTDGTFVYTGFKPAFFLVKKSSAGGNWWSMFDNKRLASFNPVDARLFPNVANAESTSDSLDFVSNGVKFRATDTDYNGSGATYIYMSFAENPFVTSTGVPATAR